MSTYRQIFKSTALIGSAQLIVILLGIIRTKVLAVLLGPAGMGLAGLYTAATDLVGTITGMGIGSSGVRQIAEAAGTSDDSRIARTVVALQRAATVSGVVGMAVVLTLCYPLSRLSFGDNQHIGGMALMSLALLCSGMTAGQVSLLQGLRRLKDLASMQILGAAFGAAAGIGVIFLLGKEGVPLYLVTISGFGLLTSWWYARRIPLRKVRLSVAETLRESRALLGMGTAFMVSTLLAAAVAYLSRILITRELGMGAVGLYQATWTLSTLYVGMVLNAMGMDYYPRLTAVANDDAAVNRMVNEQTEMGLLIALPGVLATIALAPLILRVFYSIEFVAASGVIRWQIVGIALRVASWPLGFVQVAKGRGRLFMLTELTAAGLQVALLVLGLRLFGLDGVGIAFAALYVCYTLGMLAVCRCLSGFMWSREAGRSLLISCSAVALTFLAVCLLPEVYGLASGLLLTVISGLWCLRGVQNRLDVDLWAILVKRFRPGQAT